MRYVLLLLFLTGCTEVIVGGAVGGLLGSAYIIKKDQSLENQSTDWKIAAAIKKEFIAQGFWSLYSKISVNVVNSQVFLTGAVNTSSDIVKALEICWQRDDISDVVNDLKVNNSKFGNIFGYAKDSWITSRAKYEMMRSKIKFMNYIVVTNDSIVYIFSTSSEYQEVNIVAKIISQISGVSKVVVYSKVN